MTAPAPLGFRGPLPPSKLNLSQYCLEQSAKHHPQKDALVLATQSDLSPVPAEHWSYASLQQRVCQVAATLVGLSMCNGDRVLLRLGNSVDFVTSFFGAVAAGLVPVPCSAMLTASEVAFLADDAAVSLVIGTDDLPMPETTGIQSISAGELRARCDRHPPMAYADTDAEDPAFLIYTSGTSGQPKGVLHAHRSVWGRRPMYHDWYGGICARDTVLHAGAFNWSYTLGVGLMDPWVNGATAVLYNGPRDVEVWPRLITQFGATLFATVPGLYRQILKYCDLTQQPLPSLRHGLCAGEALREPLLAAWQQCTGTSLYEALGMSECSTYVSTHPGMAVRPGSPGKPQTGRCVASLALEGGTEPLPCGEVGLLAVHRSDPGLMLGYWNRSEEEALVYRGPWFVGGDLACFDADGYVHYHGRRDDLMNAGGYRVSPLEVEACLSQHPLVGEVGVSELTVREDVTVIAAFVVPSNPDEADAGALLEHARQNLAAYKCPREIIFVDTLPRTANGKVQRRQLAQPFGA